jgi:hypothetical protein
MKLPEGGGQLALVALFGDKKHNYPDLWTLFEKLQYAIETSVGKENFTRYDECRVHGTIVSLEGNRRGSTICNRHCAQINGVYRPMDLDGLLESLLANNPFLPISVKIGGFKQNLTYSFRSRGNFPYCRSFSFQGELAVAIGWPIKNAQYTPDLNRFRRSFNQFNVLHKYHSSANAYDNDFFIVLGHTRGDLSDKTVNACQAQLRDILAGSDLLPIQITEDQLNVVAYPEGDTRLERAVAISLEEAKAEIDELKTFYPSIA